jgi:hypothetical protein
LFLRQGSNKWHQELGKRSGNDDNSKDGVVI